MIMKTELEIRKAIEQIKKNYAHVLEGEVAIVQINAPRAMMQLEAEAKLRTLHWMLGEKYTSPLKRNPHS